MPGGPIENSVDAKIARLISRVDALERLVRSQPPQPPNGFPITFTDGVRTYTIEITGDGLQLSAKGTNGGFLGQIVLFPDGSIELNNGGPSIVLDTPGVGPNKIDINATVIYIGDGFAPTVEAASSPGSIIDKFKIVDETGTIVGYGAVYDAIT